MIYENKKEKAFNKNRYNMHQLQRINVDIGWPDELGIFPLGRLTEVLLQGHYHDHAYMYMPVGEQNTFFHWTTLIVS